VSLGPTYQAKRAEVAARFTTLIQGYLDEAVADGSLAPLDTRVATLAWLGAVNEIVIQWLHGTVADLSATVPALTRVLLRSIGAGGPPHGAG
jgi:TetR/AcrR family transcriptional regulator, fatty acid metabolism regulator protein